MVSRNVIIIGGGLAGLSSAVALTEAGCRVILLESRPHLGGRATSYWLPDPSGELGTSPSRSLGTSGSHVDNCQHVTLGCCTNLDDFYRRVGASDKIRYYKRLFFVDTRGRRGVIESSALSPPFHLAPSFALFPSLTWQDKNCIARAMFAIVRSGGRPANADGVSMLDWLRGRGHTDGAIQNFWQVVLVSALNEELEHTDARYGIEVFWKGFLSTRRGFEVGIPSVPLAELYDGCRDAIVRCGGEVRTRAAVREIRLAGNAVASVRLDDGTELTADFVIAAVPQDILLDILPPELAARETIFSNLRNLKTSPITGVHFWYDRSVMSEPFLTLLGRTTQWVFNKSMLFGEHAPGGPAEEDGQYLQLVISASYSLLPLSRQEIINLCRAELLDVLPATREARLVKATVIKEAHATFSPQPGCDRWRPGQSTPLTNFFLAGDWTATGWPATMEGAVRSGYLAAEALLADCGSAQKILQPDPPAKGLVRFLSSR
jgi:zeta-carotene desaturase